MKKVFKAFTLVEMLIVMGIIIILMAVGIASGRFAIRRANKIEHQNAAEQIYQSIQSYYTDHREYPAQDAPHVLLGTSGDLEGYIDDFDGGSDASYAYWVDSTGQICIVCVTYGGSLDENDLGYYCTGNGISSTEALGGLQQTDVPTAKENEYVTDEYVPGPDVGVIFNSESDPAVSSDWVAGDKW